MKAKPVILREAAEIDIEDVLDDLRQRGSTRAATRFIDALAVACAGIGRHPAAGSPRYAHEIDIAGLRHWEVPMSRYLLFYKEFDDHVDVWRLLHRDRDVAAWMPATE